MSTDGGASFGSIVNLSNNGGSSFQPAITASINNVYVAWFDNTPGDSEIFYKKSTDRRVSFGSIVNLCNDSDNSVPRCRCIWK
jgi:hypothetical protein